MNWEAIGAIGEIIGAVAVLVTLIYLATQVRQNTNAVRTSGVSAWIDATHAFNAFAIQNAEFLNDAYTQSRALSESEELRFHFQMAQLGNGFEAVYLFYLGGTLDKTFFESKMRTMRWRLLQSPGVRAWWDATADELYDERFVGYVNQQLGEDDA